MSVFKAVSAVCVVVQSYCAMRDLRGVLGKVVISRKQADDLFWFLFEISLLWYFVIWRLYYYGFIFMLVGYDTMVSFLCDEDDEDVPTIYVLMLSSFLHFGTFCAWCFPAVYFFLRFVGGKSYLGCFVAGYITFFTILTFTVSIFTSVLPSLDVRKFVNHEKAVRLCQSAPNDSADQKQADVRSICAKCKRAGTGRSRYL